MAGSDSALEALWKNVLDDWNDDRPHAVFLEHCQAHDRLAEAAVRYRGMTGDRERGAAARKRLEAVTLLAFAKLEASRSGPAKTPIRHGAWLLVLFFLAASALLLVYM
jgi:hypothetical protein